MRRLFIPVKLSQFGKANSDDDFKTWCQINKNAVMPGVEEAE